ncbi:GAF and ANTAR domain-containing protein [Actinomadura fulvescens]|uniref:GAF and ANTAR domain-containing protein n=1 Tax=Actinomadura fulvescens TaxID=46160 RepID=A0ABP6CVU9_9ACTN
MGSTRVQVPDQRVTAAFVALADTLVTGFDLIEFLQQTSERCVELLGVDAAGLLVTDQRGSLRMMASSSEQSRLLELFELQNDQGPCPEAFATGQAVHAADLTAPLARQRWPLFTEQAARCGFAAVSALPMRLRDQVIGALNLFRTDTGELHPATVRLGQAMADVATIGLLQERTIRHGQILTEQLQTALTSRILIEQAKGVLAERHSWNMDKAFTALRDHARSHNQPLTDLARAVVTRSPEAGPLGEPPAP